MELILALIVLIIVWCIAFMVANKQGANRIVNQIKKDGGYYDMEYTSSAYPILYPTSSVNNDTMGTIGSKPKTQTDYQNEHKKIAPCVGHELESQKEIEKTPARQTKTQPLDLKKSACYVNKDSAPRPASEHGCHLA